VGARPQFIKASVISRAVNTMFSDQLEETLLHTGQHFDPEMSAIFFDSLKINAPKYHLEAGQTTDRRAALTGQIAEILKTELPDAVLVYGDTDSTRIGATAAAVCGLPVAHVEAGLRSGNWAMPEEENRVVTDHLADLLFCPTKSAMAQLAREGIGNQEKVVYSGDVMLDSAMLFARNQSISQLQKQQGIVGPYALLTLHRGANVDDPKMLTDILTTIDTWAQSESLRVVWPLHPRTRNTLARINTDWKSIDVISPVGYEEMLCLEQNSQVVLTDSGGVQKEAYFFGRPCYILRNETEWTELVTHGGHVLCGNTPASIKSALERGHMDKGTVQTNLFGNGKAGELICKEIIKRYGPC